MAYGFTYTLPTITGSHTDLVVVLKTADFPSAAIDGGASSILNGGGNLRAYTDSSKTTQLAVHVAQFVAGGSPAADVRVKVPTAATGNTIYIEADAVETVQPAVTNTYGRNAVYSNDDRVYGLKDNSSTAVDYTGTDDGTLNGTAATGSSPPFGGGNIDFNLGGHIDGLSDPFAGAARAAIRAWYKIPNEASKGIAGAWLGDSNMSVLLFTGSNDLLNFRVNTGSVATATSTTVVQDGTWHFVGGIYDGSTVKTVVDGATEGSAGKTGTILTPSSAPFDIGRYNNNNSTRPDEMMEVRLSTSANVTADYIATEYANQSAAGAWGTVGTWADSGGASSHSIVGSVTVSATPAATLDYQQHPSISGDVTITSTPSATMGFSSGYTIVGNVSLSVTPASVMDHQSHHVIAGGVQTSLTPAAVLDHQSHHAIIGDVALSVTPAATLFFGSGEYIQGDVTISSTPAGVMSFTRHAAIAGNVAVNLTPAAILDHQLHRSLVGDVSISMTPAAVMSYTGYVPLSLSQNDLDAIAESVRLMLVDQGCFTKIDEIWTRLGLNPAAPLTNHTDGSITATGIDIVASSSGENIVQTRQ